MDDQTKSVPVHGDVMPTTDELVAHLQRRLAVHERRAKSIDAYIAAVQSQSSVFSWSPPIDGGGYAELSLVAENRIKEVVLRELQMLRKELRAHIDRVHELVGA